MARSLLSWAAVTGRRPIVLVVEDDQSLREYYLEALQSRFDVHACGDGMAALQYFSHARPDAILLDLNLPRLHGRTLYNELRQQPLTSGIPIIIVTGIDPTPEVPGATVLQKPCPLDELLAVLERALVC